jgi:formylglycine-generating enzyme required for sulfatase activity
MPFQTTGNAGFFKVNQLDDQPPAIASQYPSDGGFAVPRFSNLTMQLSDATGIDTNSIQLTVGSLGTFTLTNAQLTFSNNLLTFINGGSIPLGAWGTNIQATLVIADTLGHFTSNTWSFTLEVQPQVVSNLFVFGSPQAQRTGQQIGNIATRALVKQSGPIPMDSGYPWTLAQVATNYLLLAYTNTAPGFTVGQYVCNLTPVSPVEIFYRKITGISDDPGNKKLTLFTLDVPLTEIATNGSASISSDSMVFQTDTNGAFMPAYAKALSVDGTINFPRIGCSFDGLNYSLETDPGALQIVSFTADEMHFWFYPSLRCSMETHWGALQKFEAIASGKVEAACVCDADFLLAGIAYEKKLATIHVPGPTIFLGFIGVVPVFVEVGGDFDLKGEAQAYATMQFHGGFRQTIDASVGLQYSAPDLNWVRDFQPSDPEIIPPSAAITANGMLKLTLDPNVDFLVDGLAGVAVGISPNASFNVKTDTGGALSANLSGEVDLTIEAAGPVLEAAQQALNTEWILTYPIFGPHKFWSWPPPDAGGGSPMAFTEQPASQTVTTGGSAYFSCTVSSSGTPGYQWYFNGVPIPGQTSRTLSLPGVNSGHAGNYYVRVSADGQTINSATATLTVIPKSVQSELVAWYPFNGNANDASGHGHNGTILGAVPSPDRFLILDNAYSFSGANSIQLPVNINSAAVPVLTVSVWVKPGQQGSTHLDRHMVWSHDNTGYDRSLQVESGNWSVYTGGSTYWPTGVKADTDSWQHIVVVYSTTNVALFKNGIMYLFGSAPLSDNGENFISVGKYSSTSFNESFWGSIDDIRIYNRALSVSEILSLYNSGLPAPAPSSGMALIPPGSFTMGNCMNASEGYPNELPLHSVYVSAFYMDKNDVTKSLWDSVYQWAITHGYSFDHAGSGKAANHPVQTINWYDAVKWCNARSEMEGRTPAYYTTSAQAVVYRTGDLVISNSCVNWNSGYRLPTEAEWEKAARGGASGQRFPWGNTINESQANYYSYNGDAYDLSNTGYNPAFNDGVYPLTSPVDYFAPNGYGLYDMAGNVWQWCWDWSGDYSSSSQTDPRGPTTGQYGIGSYRVLRGGPWNYYASDARCARSNVNHADLGLNVVGFRCVLAGGQ